MPVRKRVFRYDRKKDEVVEVKKPQRRRERPRWPIFSDQVGVGSHEVSEANSTMRKLGLRPNYQPDGTYMFESPGHRKEHCEHPDIEIYDRQGGYSDPMPPDRRGYEPPENPGSSFFG